MAAEWGLSAVMRQGHWGRLGSLFPVTPAPAWSAAVQRNPQTSNLAGLPVPGLLCLGLCLCSVLTSLRPWSGGGGTPHPTQAHPTLGVGCGEALEITVSE